MFKTTINWKVKHRPPCKTSTQSCDHLGKCKRECESFKEYTVNKLKLDSKLNKERSNANAYHDFKTTTLNNDRYCVIGRR